MINSVEEHWLGKDANPANRYHIVTFHYLENPGKTQTVFDKFIRKGWILVENHIHE